MPKSVRHWKHIALATALCFAATPFLAGAPAYAASSSDDSATVAQGDDWIVSRVAAGYQVSKTLAEPIEFRDAAPTLWADGVDLGIANQSLDGLTITVTTDDPVVLTAGDVALGWEGEGDPTVETPVPDAGAGALGAQRLSKALVVDESSIASILADDPATHGQYSVERDDYDLGDEAEDIRGFGRKGEMRAALFMPVGAAGERPVVLFLHGRHTSCSGGTRNPDSWPCNPDQVDVASYLGYNDAAEALASRGYAVVSISANAINALDGTLSDDNGAVARAQLILDHLELLREANEGPVDGLSPSLKGRLDLDHVGVMGHSRGGDGAVRAALLNAELEKPFGIEAVLPLAPTDFGRMTLPDVPTATILPYCDGDVSNQQGQHFFDDSQHAFDDNVLRSSVLVMGANHNFFNTSWTPSKYAFSASDDWNNNNGDPDCKYGVSPTRLTDDEQYDVGTAYVTAFFRLTMGDEQQFLPMFDGSDAKPVSAGRADVRVSASLPASTRYDVNNFDKPDTDVRVLGAGTYQYCASLSARPVPGEQPYCVNSLTTSQVPDFTPANFAQSVPATPSLHFTYTAPANANALAGEIRVPLDAGKFDVTSYEDLSFRVSPDETATGTTDLTVTLADGSGATASVHASEYGDALTVLPGTVSPLRKVLLQQLTIPTGDFAGVNLSDIREVRFTAPRAAGGVLLGDLAFLATPSVGDAKVSTRPVLSIPDVNIEEGDGPATAYVPVLLSRSQDVPTTAWFSAVGTANGKVDLALKKLTFEPGQTCIAVPVPTKGDNEQGTTQSAKFKMTVSNTQEGSTIGDSFGYLTVREDDGVVTPTIPSVPPRGGNPGTPEIPGGDPLPSAPAVGVQGDACAEATAEPGTLTVSPASAERGDSVTITGSGFRSGESVSFAFHSDPVDLGSLVSTDGTVSLTTTVPDDAEFGAHEFQALGAGSAFTATGALEVVDPNAPTDEPTDTPTDVPTDTPTDVPTDTPSDTPTDAPLDPGSDGTTPGSTTSGTAAGLASTGFEGAGWALLALLLIGGGATVFFARRKRVSQDDAS
ncbi:hypothetical protein [Compostimonas suwonensis]|uniref:PET hydrolase/cutinase-like domain-containing protein n=1 Tax=Compostimonas suwonensis TaxID=1048394 RepID=A0A2M9BCQ1_9MICO|nr:hypothetical protein [Compostimonas suwonensis]PJJ55725.1 hypothetical protein CLV54_3076 [Compostimonas suwonensis]